jgi:hypothetical protein
MCHKYLDKEYANDAVFPAIGCMGPVVGSAARCYPRVGWSGNERLSHTESVLQLVMHLLSKHQQWL